PHPCPKIAGPPPGGLEAPVSKPVALITGASRGIGKQLAIDLAADGYDLVVCARSTADSPARLPGTIDETAKLAREQGADVLVAPLDVRDEEAVAALADTVYERFGRCDLLINNAAVGVPGATLENSTKRWRLATDINIHGPFYLIYYFCPRMREAGEGRVINISSGASVNPGFRRISYTTTKRALEAMTEGFAIELEDSVAVNCIRLELGVWTEGYAFTLGDVDRSDFEDPVIMSDAVLWMAKQPLDYTGQVVTIADLREQGAVRPKTTAG
ncbi:MAG: SDR family NAD(P)-dependent oxidoreductase, partial [Dehalococcoidia bacterium]|nr:SDR family NAD(P)-dependent oxidoreductase [Dehalococcoidia bacterium]